MAAGRQLVRAWLACLLWGCIGATAAAADSNPRQGFRDVGSYNVLPVTDPAGMAEWLLRLVDQYHVEGMGRALEFDPFPVKGTADCAPVGAGPGIHCIFNVQWIDRFEPIVGGELEASGIYSVPGGVSYLGPSMMLMGMDPPRKGLKFLLVDNKGLPEGGAATLAGDRATLRAPCVNAPVLFLSMAPKRKFDRRPPQYCERIMRIDARPGSTVVHLAIDIEINGELATQFQMTLRRGKIDVTR